MPISFVDIWYLAKQKYFQPNISLGHLKCIALIINYTGTQNYTYIDIVIYNI